MPTPQVQFSLDDSIAYLTLNRPAAKNALTWAMYDGLVEVCERVDADADIRVLVIRSIGDAFAAGTDIKQFSDILTGDDGLHYEQRLDAIVERLERVEVPTIAQVQGIAAGAGCIIALACDLRVCSPNATFGMPMARTLGNCLSAANYARLVDAIGPARTKDLLFTARFIDVNEAAALGLVTRLAPADAVDDVVRELAATVAQHAPLTLLTTKETLRRQAIHRRLPHHSTDDLIDACYASEDFREGVAAFLAKRRPAFNRE
jgi:enoyl-CoA hydratase/carnithine racemase